MSARHGSRDDQFTGKFLFINKDVRQHDTTGQRNAINAHVQGQYHRWRRQKDARQLREMAKLPIRPHLNAQGSTESTDSDSSGTGKETMKTQTQVKAVVMRFRLGDEENTASQQAPISSPRSLLAKGNSDPFLATAVTVTPEISRLISYSSTLGESAAMFIAEKRQVHAKTNSTVFENGHFALQDVCHGSAHLAVIAFSLATSSGDLRFSRQALALKNRSAVVLCSRLKQKHQPVNEQSLLGICCLFCLELPMGNSGAAAFHVRMLFDLLAKSKLPETLDLRVRESAVYVDTYFASIFLTRPLIDFESWMPKRFEIEWRDLISTSLALQPRSPQTPLHSAITDTVLRQILYGFRELLDLDMFLTNNPHLCSANTFRRMHIRKLGYEARLINHYLDLTATPKHSPCASTSNSPYGMSSPSDNFEGTFIQACACVAVLHWSGLAFGNRQKGNCPTQLPNHLLASIQSLQHDLTKPEHAMHPELMLWMLYVGAMTDEMVPNPSATQQGWYTRELARHVKTMRLRSWHDMRTILQKFLYTESLIPDHAAWCQRKILVSDWLNLLLS